MKLSKIYSNKPKLFAPVVFHGGVNVIMAEIRLPQNRNRDTHNLGKTTLGRLLDFCFLDGRDPNFFLLKHESLFDKFVFFLEIEIEAQSYVTIRRSVAEPTKICFKRHKSANQDFSKIEDNSWDHFEVPFDRAKQLLDGILDWRALKPWPFRKIIGYLIRSQDDFREVFHLRKFASKHADWKPFLGHILGFNGELLQEHYKKEEELTEKETVADTIKNELGGSAEDISKIEGILLLKKQEADKKQKLLDAFDFRAQDKLQTKKLVTEIDVRIAELNETRYSLNQNRRKIIEALEEEQILFNPDEAKKLFEEAGVLFQGQIQKDFQQLIAFNKAITEERRVYLVEELAEIEDSLKKIGTELTTLGKKRSDAMSFLSTTDIFGKYKHVSEEMISLRADITALERQRNALHRLQELRNEIRKLKEEKSQIQAKVEADTNAQNANDNSLFSAIRVYFSEIVEEVIDRKALLSVLVNRSGHLDFKAEILDQSGNSTSADMGFTYRKLLCIAFDLAVLRAHSNVKFPRFVYHDGVFESLDDRKKENLLAVIRRYTTENIQPIITLIDSDLPTRTADSPAIFSEDEIILTLHDEGDQGRLFKMSSW